MSQNLTLIAVKVLPGSLREGARRSQFSPSFWKLKSFVFVCVEVLWSYFFVPIKRRVLKKLIGLFQIRNFCGFVWLKLRQICDIFGFLKTSFPTP